MTGPAPKRPRRSEEECRCGKRKKHLYLALYERKAECGSMGLSIHKLDADNLEDDDALPEPVLRFAAPERAPMDLTAVGTSIFVATSPHLLRRDELAPGPPPPLPTLVYDTETATLTIGPLLPDGYLDDDNSTSGLPAAVGGDRLYALTRVYDDELRQPSVSLRVLSRTPTTNSWVHSETRTIMAWSWNGHPPPPSPPSSLVHDALDLTSYAVHPDGRTIFMSTRRFTWSFDTGNNGVWKELGRWSLPFTGQAYFDGDLDAWVGVHGDEDGYVCCCRVPSRTTTSRQPPEYKMLKEKMFIPSDDHWMRRRQKVTLNYMGDSRFCLVQSVPNSRSGLDATLHVTLFGLRYDHNAVHQGSPHH